jgi:hypothetical protein
VLRIEEDDRARDFESLKPLARNLTEFSAINNACRFLSASAIQKIMGKINAQTLESITLTGGVYIDKSEVREILSPLEEASLKKLQLQRIAFERKAFKAFIYYLSNNFSSDGFSLSLEDIWDEDYLGNSIEIVNPMSYWHNPRTLSKRDERDLSPVSRLFP